MNPFARTQWNGQLGEVLRMLKMGAIMKFMQIMSGFSGEFIFDFKLKSLTLY